MTIARRHLVSLDHTPYYHCTSRCVRRAYLCGKDHLSGQDFSHRRQWIEDRLCKLTEVFAIDLLGYAVMSNHYHVIIKLDPARARSWTDDEVEERWSALYRLPETYRLAASSSPSAATAALRRRHIACWRARLADLGWYMRAINEPVARWANREDGCSGRFWQGRYSSQALLDEAALIRCMAYVDLNPIRAGMADHPEHSDHTSIQARIEHRADVLVPFLSQELTDTEGSTPPQAIPMPYQHYLQLLDWTGRAARHGKHGIMPTYLPAILARLRTDQKSWLRAIHEKKPFRYRALGSIKALRAYCEHLQQQWIVGMGATATLNI